MPQASNICFHRSSQTGVLLLVVDPAGMLCHSHILGISFISFILHALTLHAFV